ncbi:MAG TPA: hypothetical protein VFQ61_34140 [Polyangiaceae bacterium]|nr:hypothetical protein [Polyangiaceae bacterium]
MIVPHPFDIIAILLGLFFALRKSDVRTEELSRHPRANAADFERWQALAFSAYTFGARICFAKVMADVVFLTILRQVTPPLNVQRTIGVSMDLAWMAAVAFTFIRARRARRFAEQHGIDLRRSQRQDAEDQA